MKICTFNIWNEEVNFDIRLKLLVKELKRNEIDILALQEVKSIDVFNKIKEETRFLYGYYNDGVGILSKLELEQISSYSENNNYMIRVKHNNTSITNVHFDWKKKENRLSGLEHYFDMLEEVAYENEIILGDFNDIPESELHFELALQEFDDVHQIYSHSINEVPKPTLDILNNPRWRNKETDEDPYRFDWTMINTTNKYTINSVKLIGTEEENEISPSDHYGVLADIDIKI